MHSEANEWRDMMKWLPQEGRRATREPHMPYPRRLARVVYGPIPLKSYSRVKWPAMRIS